MLCHTRLGTRLTLSLYSVYLCLSEGQYLCSYDCLPDDFACLCAVCNDTQLFIDMTVFHCGCFVLTTRCHRMGEKSFINLHKCSVISFFVDMATDQLLVAENPFM